MKPVLIFGFERSGTTLLSMMLGAHPELALPLTVTGMWYTFAGKMHKFGDIFDEKNTDALINELLNHERIRLWDEPFTLEEIKSQLDKPDYASVISAFHKAYAKKKAKPYWANLDIATLDRLDQAYKWFPDARFIHIVRDGRDVALSHETMPYGAANTLDCARSWERRLTTNMKMANMLPDGQYHIVRYEDLIMEPEATLKELCRFIGLNYSEQMLAYGNMVGSKIPDDKRWLWPALDKPPQKDKCYAWKKRMAPRKRAVFEREAGNLLRSLGYETYDHVPRSLSSYLWEFWCIIGHGGRLRRLARALGLSSKSRLEKDWRRSHG